MPQPLRVLIFEDDQVRQLHPITTGRPAYAVTCGGYRLLDWLEQLPTAGIHGAVRPHLREIQRHDFPELSSPSDNAPPRLLINARLVPSHSVFQELERIVRADRAGVARDETGTPAAMLLAPSVAVSSVPRTSIEVDDFFHRLGVDQLPSLDARLPLFQYPHDVVRHHMQCLGENLEYRLQGGEYEEVRPGVFAAAGVKLSDYVVSDCRDGPILLEQNVRVGPHSFLSGPAWIGAETRLIEHASIKDGVSVGHTAKIGGEVEASIIEPYTNKQHYGFLGHSYLGSWINLGAGTCNSDLKNTYGSINMEYRGQKVATDMQFLGCIMGDYAKSAINTGIFTGKTIGTCSMLYGFVTTNVPSFVSYARLFGQITETPPEVLVATQQRMFTRRKVKQRSCDIQLLHDMHELTRDERAVSGEQMSF